MGFGDTAKKLQTVADTAEKLYARLNDLRDQLQELRRRVEETSDKVDRIERDVTGQRALLVALAEERGIDADAVLTEAAIDEAEMARTGTTAGRTTDGDPTTEPVSDDPPAEGVATNDDGTAVTAEANASNEANAPSDSNVAMDGEATESNE